MAIYRLPSPYEQSPLRRRASGFALAVGVNFLLLLVLLSLGVVPTELPKGTRTLVVDLIPAARNAAAPEHEARSKAHAVTRPAAVPPTLPKPRVAPAKRTNSTALPMLEMSKDEFAATDISKLPKASDGSGAGDSEEVGRGPNGEVLYAAEWARHPTAAELDGYLPRNAPDGFGLIACKTIPGDRVDDCIELDQEPHGSHLAGAVRQAAWQFRVRPPRKNGRPMIGSWVRIRIDYYHVGGPDDGDPNG